MSTTVWLFLNDARSAGSPFFLSLFVNKSVQKNKSPLVLGLKLFGHQSQEQSEKKYGHTTHHIMLTSVCTMKSSPRSFHSPLLKSLENGESKL